MVSCNPFATPGDGIFPTAGALLDTQTTRHYQELVGRLIYLVCCTRSDIIYAVMQLSWSQSKSSAAYLAAGKQLLLYIKGTQDTPLLQRPSSYASSGEANLSDFADPSLASDTSTSRSISGNVNITPGAAITWSSKAQPTLALSTTEAVYMALT
ncbi:unnamed protein product [Discosporangium mesarthrocarpum]